MHKYAGKGESASHIMFFPIVFFFTFPIVFVIGLACVFTHAIGWYEVTLCMETMHSLYALFSVLCV